MSHTPLLTASMTSHNNAPAVHAVHAVHAAHEVHAAHAAVVAPTAQAARTAHAALPPLDLRSDTVTRPSTGMRDVMCAAEVGDDVLDGDPTTRAFEAEIAERFGKDAALFFPSGCMANQAAVWLHSTPGTEIMVDAEAHIVHWELAGAAALAGVQLRPVHSAGRPMTAHDLAQAIRAPSAHTPDTSLVCLENTHNGAGGAVVPLTELRALQAVAQEMGVPVHLDGARLWNAHVATGTSLADFAACADSVMVSFAKGLGAPVGAMLLGTADLIRRAIHVRKRFGGGMRQTGMLAAAARYGLHHHLASLADDHAAAQRLGQALDGAGGARVVPPDTNILMVDLPAPCAAAVVAEAAALGVRLSQWNHTRVRAVTHRDVDRERLAAIGPELAECLVRVIGSH